MSLTGTRIRKGDTVRVLLGKDKGKEGKVLRAIAPVENPKKKRPARLVVEGINTVIKHQRARPQQNPTASAPRPESGRIEIDAPIYASKVQLVCPNCAKLTRIGTSTTAEGERYRSCKHCDKRID
jgi:large subunit ribosomal protein L24